MLATSGHAAVENVVAQVTFADPVTIVEVNSLQFGIIDHVLNTELIILGTDDSVGGSGAGLVLGGTQAAAELTVDGEASQVLTILIDGIVDGTGYALSAFVCSYNGGADTACNSLLPTAVASAPLLIGATITGDNLATPGPANGSFNVTILYQ
jgi:hypothetical protein